MISYIQYIQDQLEIAKACAKSNGCTARHCEHLFRGELQRIDKERAKAGRLTEYI